MSGAAAALHRVPAGYAVHGHAIVSRDDMFADAAGMTPPELRNPADWRRFQAALDAAALTVLGRRGHEIHAPPTTRRRRLVISGGVAALEHRGEAWWWNPTGCQLEAALAEAAPQGGVIAVVGGQRVFDLFFAIGYDEFHLARAASVVIGNGPTLFSAVGPGRSAEDLLRGSGLVPAQHVGLDRDARVDLTIWRRHTGVEITGTLSGL